MLWQQDNHSSVPTTLEKMITKFCDVERFPALANFYLLVKSHKPNGLCFEEKALALKTDSRPK